MEHPKSIDQAVGRMTIMARQQKVTAFTLPNMGLLTDT